MFLNNSAYTGGAGIHNEEGASPQILNCIFAWNSGYNGGGGISNEFDSNPAVVNCVFVGNSSTNSGGAIANLDSSPTVINCILWGNSPDEVYSSGGNPVVIYSDIRGEYPGEGNMNADPEFLPGGFLLSEGSPCIDTGTSENAPNTDIRGVSRPHGSGWDMGAYECAGADPGLPLNVWVLPIVFLLLAAAVLTRGEQILGRGSCGTGHVGHGQGQGPGEPSP
jgi:hypothetical protein